MCYFAICRQVLHGSAGGMSQQMPSRNQQQLGSVAVSPFAWFPSYLLSNSVLCSSLTRSSYILFEQEVKTEMNSRASGPEASLIGIPGIICDALESS